MSDWTSAPLSDVADIRFSNVDKKTHVNEEPVLLCNYMDVYANEYVTADLNFMSASATRLEIDKFRVDAGDVIITKDSETPDDIGIAAVVRDAVPGLVCGYHLALLKIREEMDPVFLAKQLGSPEIANYFAQRASGSTRYGLSARTIAETPIKLAPSAEQRKIGEIFLTLDDAIARAEALIAKMQRVKVGMMRDLFTRGVTPDGRLRPTRAEAPKLYKETLLGWIPKEWEVVPLSRCLGGSPRNGLYKTAAKIGEGNLLVGQTAFTPAGSLDFEFARRAEVTAGELQQFGLTKDNLLITRVFATAEGVGRPILVPELPEQAVYESNMIRLIVADTVVSPYLLFQWLQLPFARSWVLSNCNASNQTSLNQTGLLTLPIAIAPAREQQTVLTIMLAADDRLADETANLGKLAQIKSGLMHDLLAADVRIGVSPQVPSRG